MLKGRERRRVVLVGHHPERAIRGVALTDGAQPDGQSYFEILERMNRVDGVWLHLQNMELKEGRWFHIRDCESLRIVGNAAAIKKKFGWPD